MHLDAEQADRRMNPPPPVLFLGVRLCYVSALESRQTGY
jgi:hypothetical protein